MVRLAPPPNRILADIARTRQRFVEDVILGDVAVDRLPAISLALNLTAQQYGELRDRVGTQLLCAQVDPWPGELSDEEADTLLDILGYSVNHFNRQSIAVKSVVIREFADVWP